MFAIYVRRGGGINGNCFICSETSLFDYGKQNPIFILFLYHWMSITSSSNGS